MNRIRSNTCFVRISLVCLLLKSFSFGASKKKIGLFAMSLFTSKGFEDKTPRKTTALYDTFQSESLCKMVFFDEVSSTMDKAKELQSELLSHDVYAVVANHQTAGRGTRGRTWKSLTGNVMMTIAFKVSAIHIPLTLIPLRIGTIIAPIIRRQISSDHTVFLKWPNDVLIDDKKVCGILIEIDGDRVFVGIGCNIQSVPDEDSILQSGGRTPTCTSRYPPKDLEVEVDGEVKDSDTSMMYLKIAEEIGVSVGRWVRGSDSGYQVLRDFETLMDFSRPLQLRTDSLHRPISVTPLYLNDDGTLQIREVEIGIERALIAEYLY